MSEERLVNIESKLAHQEQLLIELNGVITDQQAQIMKLEEIYGALVDRVRAIGAALPGDGSQDERPPHY
ncbi:MAG: SlyX family protein [Gammaproteobacteria bacterium]|nr:SlyX family protein [Gammaproteobacteria bacterium]MDH3373158.1 SlyX family protein [Gammaproteobacteria bacterium]MDH3551416.1 SlyX family protein [Gammaproteobacteria bacterium]